MGITDIMGSFSGGGNGEPRPRQRRYVPRKSGRAAAPSGQHCQPERPPSMAHAFSSRFSSLRKLQSVPSAIILFGAGGDHADFVQPQRVEPHRVLGVELAPAVVRDLGQRLKRVIVALVNPPSTSRRAALSGSAAHMSAALRMARIKRFVATG